VSKNVTKKGCPGKGGPFFLEARLMDRERKRKNDAANALGLFMNGMPESPKRVY